MAHSVANEWAGQRVESDSTRPEEATMDPIDERKLAR
jgi:hypothetical protein